MNNINLEEVNNNADDTGKTTSESEIQSFPTIVYQPEPETELLSYVGCDSTSVNGYAILDVVESDEDKALRDWIKQVKKPKKGQTKSSVISNGINLVKSVSDNANRLINDANKNFAERAVIIGQVCLELKDLLRQKKQSWGVWAEENLPFIQKRNREKYMLLASRPDCWPFSFLGVDRLEMLCSVTKGNEGEDRIGNLLEKYQIPFDDKVELNMAEFKIMVDAAIAHEKLERDNLNFEYKLVLNGINSGVAFDKDRIKEFKEIQECGGNPEIRLKKLILARGKEDVDESSEKRLQDFNSLSNRLIKTLEYITADHDQLLKIDRDTFLTLMDKLMSIKESGVFDEDEEAA